MTNLVPTATNTLVITNESSTNLIVSNYFIFGSVSNYIGNTNYSFGTNIVYIGGAAVTLGTNILFISSPSASTNDLGTNTTVTTTSTTNSTNYTFVANTLNVTTVSNTTGPGSWAIYNLGTKALTAIPTNVYFDIHTDLVYDDGTNAAYTHGENIKHDGEIQYGTTDEIRTLVFSNATMNIKLAGYAHGHLVPVTLSGTGTDVVHSQDYNWTGSGSGVISNTVPTVIAGDISEQYFKLLK